MRPLHGRACSALPVVRASIHAGCLSFRPMICCLTLLPFQQVRTWVIYSRPLQTPSSSFISALKSHSPLQGCKTAMMRFSPLALRCTERPQTRTRTHTSTRTETQNPAPYRIHPITGGNLTRMRSTRLLHLSRTYPRGKYLHSPQSCVYWSLHDSETSFHIL